jgi:prepilin-type N-terminal cleavage/methylation domain-containing protein
MKAGLYGWFNKNLTQMKGRKGQQGFTLIELLVVVTILGVLAAIVTLSLVGLTTNANVQACNTEYKTVQTALDAFMADNNLATVSPLGPTQHMDAQIGPSNAAYALFVDLSNPPTGVTQSRNYTRNGTTQFFYRWDTHGKINLITKSTTVTDTLPNCSVIS